MLVSDEPHIAQIICDSHCDRALKPMDELEAEQVIERRVHDDETVEKRRGPDTLCAVNNLHEKNKGIWGDIIAERAYGTEGEDGVDTERLEGSHVRSRWNG
jgi:hypothetical protein